MGQVPFRNGGYYVVRLDMDAEDWIKIRRPRPVLICLITQSMSRLSQGFARAVQAEAASTPSMSGFCIAATVPLSCRLMPA